MQIKFEWDENRARRNQLKHGVGFDVAKNVFADPGALSLRELDENGDGRCLCIGKVGNITLVLQVLIANGIDGAEVVTIVSARRADRNERIRHEQHTRPQTDSRTQDAIEAL